VNLRQAVSRDQGKCDKQRLSSCLRFGGKRVNLLRAGRGLISLSRRPRTSASRTRTWTCGQRYPRLSIHIKTVHLVSGIGFSNVHFVWKKINPTPRRLQDITMRFALSLTFFLMLAAAQSVPAAPRLITGAGFNYYVLSLYWLPTLCLESPGADECSESRRSGFVVHGLWPVLDWNSPTNCGGSDILSDSLVGSLKDLMPTHQIVEREWTEHGTCTGESPDRFFTMLRQAYDSVNIPPLGEAGADVTQTIHQITKAFTNRDPGLFAQAIVLTCSDNPARLREVRICLSKNLASNFCTGETIRASCRTLNIQIPAAR
jgi:ribonuclease T2